MKKLFAIVFLFLSASTINAQQYTLVGNWEGQINIQSQQLIIKTHFMAGDSLRGTIDIPQQGGHDIPLQNIAVEAPDSIFFEFPAGPGLAEFKGAFQDNSTITGTFHQRGMQFSFEMSRYRPKADTSDKNIKKEAKPYHHTDLIIEHDSVNIGGTLTRPKEQQTGRLVIMISGSGAQDRDESLLPITDFKPFATLADSLTGAGIATFRYDDRGVGESTGNFAIATLDILADDVEAIIEEFTAGNNPNFNEIILLGHSQGGVVAGKVAAENTSVDKLILMASTGVPLKEVLRFQAKQLFRNASIDSQLVEQEIAARESLMEAIRTRQGISRARNDYRKRFAAIQMAAGADSAQANTIASNQAQQLQQTFKSPQIQSLLFYDPTEDLQQIKIPVLVLFGGKDTQVTVEMNKAPISQALETAGVDHKIQVFDQANHLFQKAETGQVQEYGQLDQQFTDGFLQTIEQWIKKSKK
jgi:pimeloyl-ACP methyl ester carboxylesterase